VKVNGRGTRRVSQCVPLMMLVGLLLDAHVVMSQAPANRFWGSLGAGAGHSGPANSTGLDQFTGPTVDLTAGLTMTARGFIGLEATAWRKTTPIGPSRSAFVTLTLLGYPFGSALDNLYFQGGLGFANASVPTKQTTATPSRLNVTRPSLQVALGYDIPVACPIWITPFFQSYGTMGGRRIVNSPAGVHESANAILFHGGIALKFAHPGPAGQCRQRGPAMTQ